MNFPTEFFTWETLATLGGAAVAVFTVVQMTKALLPHWLPVRIYAWFWGWVVLSGAALSAASAAPPRPIWGASSP